MAVPMKIRLGTHVSLTNTSDATTFEPCTQQLLNCTVDDNKIWYTKHIFHPLFPSMLQHYMFVNNNKYPQATNCF